MHESAANHARLQTWKLKVSRRENRHLADALAAHERAASASDLTKNRRELLLKFIDRLRGCGSKQVGRHFADGAYNTLHVLTCKHRMCHICNARRRKLTRAVWRHAYATDPTPFRNYDLMHIVLTVPHTANGWKGQQVYDAELRQCFTKLRKMDFWDGKTDKKYGGFRSGYVMGGLYSTEFTRNNEGLHIHIHALAFVHRGHDNRNKLNRELLVAWNNLTTDPSSHRQAFTAEQINGICRSLSVGKATPAEDGVRTIGYTACQFISHDLPKLKPSGATLIHCENAYYYEYDRVKGKPTKRYLNDKSTDVAIQKAIEECLKYHFKPANIYTVEDRTKTKKQAAPHAAQKLTYNVPLIEAIIEAIQGKRLYGKFGDFYAGGPYAHLVKLELDDIDTDPEELLTATAVNSPAVNPNTGNEEENYGYSLVTTAQVSAVCVQLTPLTVSITKIVGQPLYTSKGSLREALIAFNLMALKPDIQNSPTRRHKRDKRVAEMHPTETTE